MLKACIEKISTGESTWIPLPNGDLSAAITDFTGDRDWECVIITGVKEDGITQFPRNSFEKCDIFAFNDMLLQANDFKYNDDNLAVLNLFLEDRNHNCEEVINLYEQGNFYVYHNAEHMGDVAMEYLENNSSWYREAKENFHYFDSYFDFKSYGENILASDGNWLQDKQYKIIVEVYE